uniref:Uncharacterized protein n=1 Tax=Arundo donax TaxID=35708 RepID=A0A0A9FET5_ARUDO
MAAPPPRRS